MVSPVRLGRKRRRVPWLGVFLGGIVTVSIATVWIGSSIVATQANVDHSSSTLPNGVAVVQQPPNGYSNSPVIVSRSKDSTTTPTTTTELQPVKIGHVISLITCQKASRVKGFLDALVILRHSIHQNSVHNAASGSKYSYQMYAILHPEGDCTEHVPLLKRLGYIPLVLPTPVNITDIPADSYYRKHVESENCCGSKEFIKLYAYTLDQHEVVVHWDLDVAVLQPLDDLADAMIFPKDSEAGQAARQRLQVQHKNLPLPDKIDAFFTKDVTSSQPWERVQGVQGGFLVARPDKQVFRRYQEFILEANYSGGRGPTSGWGGMGYGGFQGAMAYQGVLAYFYDILYPGHGVELDVCRWNQVVADVIWRGPNRMENHGQCRQYPLDGNFEKNTIANGRCEDCRVLPIEETRTVHYTACKKPWECQIPTPRVPRNPKQAYRLNELTNVTTCGLLFRKYFEFRRDIEDRIAKLTGGLPSQRDGMFHPEQFMGYCKRSGGYQSIDIPDDLDMKQVYGF